LESVRLQISPFSWQRIGNALKIRGIILKEGTYTGIDGHTIYYPAEVIAENAETILNKPIKSRHADRDKDVIGFWTAARIVGDALEAEGVIFDPDEIEQIVRGEKNGLSLEADVDFEPIDDTNVARRINFTGGAIVENPACPSCRVESVVPIRLQKQLKEEIREMSEMQKKPTREEFFKWLEGQLKNAGVEADVLSKIMEVLKTAIKTPYPYPYPKPAKAYPQPKAAGLEESLRQAGLTESQIATIKEVLEAPEEARLATELEKPTRAAFLRWLRKQFKEAGFETAEIGKIIAVIKKAIKTPYPYPYPKPVKAKGEDLDALWDETVEELENQVEQLQSQLEQKEIEIAEFKKKLDEVKKAELARKEEEINGLINEIKSIDESFDAKTFLEGIDNVDVKLSVLKRYSERVKNLQPAIKLAGVQQQSPIEKKVENVLLSTFGTTDLDSLLKKEEK